MTQNYESVSPKELNLIAQNNEHNSNNEHTANAETSASHHEETSAEKGAESGNVFTELLGELGDHDHLSIGPYKICDLPVILVDDGLHVYGSKESMIQEGKFNYVTEHEHGKIVRTSDGKAPTLDLSITNLVVFEWLALFLVALMFNRVSSKYKKNPKKAPSGFQNFLESLILFIRDEVVYPNISSVKAADKLMPYFITLFMFILVMNMMGLIPGAHTATGSIAVTGALAITAFFVINVTAIIVSGPGHWFEHLLGGAPVYLAPIMIPIEILGLFVKPFALTIRLFANMIAGHVILLSLLGTMIFFGTLLLSPIYVGFSVFMYLLELLVAFIQAYIFTMLTAIFVGLAIGEHSGHHEAEHSH